MIYSTKTAKYIAHLIPLLFIYKSVPVILQRYEYWEGLLKISRSLYYFLIGLSVPFYLKLKPRYSDKPIDSFIQVIMIVLWIVGLRLFYQGYLKLVIQSF
jgi:miniconductance mechanosensitive channel